MIQEWDPTVNVPLMLYNAGPASPSEPPQSRPWLEVVCRGYRPRAGARCSKSWIKGTEKIDIDLPTYAMTTSQCSATDKKLAKFLETAHTKLVEELAVGQHPIIASTLQEAVRQAETVRA